MNKLACIAVICIIVATLEGRANAKKELGRGLGDDYNWHTLEEGLKLAKDTGKPLMLIIHKSWCGACRAFKPKFEASKDILKLSKHFVMVNTLDDEEPKEAKYSPDGGYIPRILFLDSMGKVHTEIQNVNGNPKYKYFYFEDKAVVSAMEQAIKTLSPNTRTEEL